MMMDRTVVGRDSYRMIPARRTLVSAFPAERFDEIAAVGLSVIFAGCLVVSAIRDHDPLILGLAPAALAAVGLRRRWPGPALLIAVAVIAVDPGDRVLVLPLIAVLYGLALRAPWRLAVLAAAGSASAAIVADAAWGGGRAASHEGLLGYAIGASATCAAAVASGLYVGAQGRIRAALTERAERLERERTLQAERAVAEERVRIAQELHDIVAHNVSLMVVQAQALAATVPEERVVRGTEAIADLGRQAMKEMHTTLRLLRDEGRTPELSPQPGLAQLDHLIDQLRDAGLAIELSIEGRPRQLTPGVDLSAYRIIQEALTNVVKHAHSASTRVALAYGPDAIEMTILDTEPDELRPAAEPDVAGHGVIGMRERASLFGGQLQAEPLPDGYRITATLPYEPTPS